MVAEWLSNSLVVLGLIVVTIGVYGLFRMPDIYTQLHAASKAVFLGVIAILVASMLTGGSGIAMRAILIVALLILTTPVSAMAIGRAALRRREHQVSPDAIDESGHLRRPLPDDPPTADPPADGTLGQTPR